MRAGILQGASPVYIIANRILPPELSLLYTVPYRKVDAADYCFLLPASTNITLTNSRRA